MGNVNTGKATCGHDDMFGYITNTVCAKCAKAGHRSVTMGHKGYSRKGDRH